MKDLSDIKLNSQINENEIKDAIKKLKNGKAVGYDGYSSEMLKYSMNYLISPLKTLFNLILKSGIYPKICNTSIITHIFKEGDIYDPGNYRGIIYIKLYR